MYLQNIYIYFWRAKIMGSEKEERGLSPALHCSMQQIEREKRYSIFSS